MNDTDAAWIEALIQIDVWYRSGKPSLSPEAATARNVRDDEILAELDRRLAMQQEGSREYETTLFQIFALGGAVPLSACNRPVGNLEEWREVNRVLKDSLKGKGWNRPNKSRGKKFVHDVQICLFELHHYQQFFRRNGIGKFVPTVRQDGGLSPALTLAFPANALSGDFQKTALNCLNGSSMALTILWDAIIRNDHQFFETLAWEIRNRTGPQSEAGRLASVAITARQNLGRNPTRRELQILGPRHGLFPASWPKLFDDAGLSSFLPTEQGRRNDLYSNYLRIVKNKK